MSTSIAGRTVALARKEAMEEAAELANEVYLDLIANGNVCPCGNGRVPVSAYRVAADAYAAAIRRLADMP